MTDEKEKTTVQNPSVGADGGQPSQICADKSISEESAEINPPDEDMEEMYRQMLRMSDPYYLHTVSMTELYQTSYKSRPPVIDGLLYAGAYILAGAPKIGKSFLVAQLAYHVSTGQKLWDYPLDKAMQRPGANRHGQGNDYAGQFQQEMDFQACA